MKSPTPDPVPRPPADASARPRVVLGLETAGETCGVAAFALDAARRDGSGRVVAEAYVRRANQHAARLAPLVAHVLDAAGAVPADVAAVALSAGPGSYTGLRIGASLAKGFCEATGAALVAVGSLDALAEAARPAVLAGERLATVFPSRRGEVYAALYLRNEADLGVRPDIDLQHADAPDDAPLDPEIAALLFDPLPGYDVLRGATPLAVEDAAAWAAEGRGPLVLAGDGAGRLVAAVGPDALLPETVAAPSAAVVARLGARRFAVGLREDVAAWAPLYLKAWSGS